MDAIVSITRRGGPSIAGGSLYSTTFPCHSCARHIVAAGIVKVLYIEPYEKSLALDLHSDAIISDVEDDASTKVQFLHFEGVAPRQYQELFFAKGERKKNGKAIPYNSRHASKLRVQYLDGYRDLESKVLKFLIDTGFTEMQIAEISSPAALTD
jgi:tRNA(Arg) A34 adenosine deaminase TadA